MGSIPRSTASDITQQVSDKALALKKCPIIFSKLEKLKTIAAGFQHLVGSPAPAKVVGSIDGCHLRIKPSGAAAECYFNKKLFYSIKLQALCGHQCLFVDICTR